MSDKTGLQSAIEDLRFMKARATDAFSDIVWGMAITICEQYLEKPNREQEVQASVATEDDSSTGDHQQKTKS